MGTKLVNPKKKLLELGVQIHVAKIRNDPSKIKWDFIFEGNKITASIKDENFRNFIRNGAPCFRGDVLEVDLQINQTWDVTCNNYVNKSYQILSVLRLLKASCTH